MDLQSQPLLVAELVGLGVGGIGGVAIGLRDGEWYLAIMSAGVLLLIYELVQQRETIEELQGG